MSAASRDKEAPLTAEEAAALQVIGPPSLEKDLIELSGNTKLREAGKNCKVFQQKVDALFESVVNYRKRRDMAIEEVAIKKDQLSKTNEAIARLNRQMKILESDKTHREALATNLERQLGLVNGQFRYLVGGMRESTRRATGGLKATTSKFTSAALASERGYDCGVGSTFSLQRNAGTTKSATNLLQFNQGWSMNPPKEGKYLAERCSLIQGLRGVMEEMTAKGTLTGAEADTLVGIAFEELLAEFDDTPTAERRIVVRNGMIGMYRYNAGEWELTFSYPDFSLQDARSNAICPLGGPSIGLIGTGEPIIKGRRKNKGRGGPQRSGWGVADDDDDDEW
ncbi:pumilio domain member 4 [Perkinsus olseni]|uniref:Pumilio domain member 4 n=1 Tax=Perkinsus olseni TaxID=32597 RepID=A0A7J6MRM8_PEROL|nr:pumilio domain member 4 [Perkinsus olseni]